MTYRKKLIEVALPLEAINKEAAREKSIRHGHPSTLHLWWARRPLAAARAVLFGQLVDDPSSWPELFKTEAAREEERKRLFSVIEELVKWENSNNETVLNAARLEIARSHARSSSSPKAKKILDKPQPEIVDDYLATEVPPVYDPFAGGGTIPLEAQRLGLRAIASDLNPVAVMINKALIEIPPKFAGKPPVNPEAHKKAGLKTWKGAQGLANDVRYYGQWIRDEAFRRIGHLYPEVDLPEVHGGGTGTVIAWLWARTVASPNPAFEGARVPLVSNFFLSTREGKETWVEPVVKGHSYRFEIRTGKPGDKEALAAGTKIGRGAHFKCVLSNTPIEPDYIKAEGKAGRMGARLMAVVAQGRKSRAFLAPMPGDEELAQSATAPWFPEERFAKNSRHLTPWIYGLERFGDLFTQRQLLALNTFAELVADLGTKVGNDCRALNIEPAAYANALMVYLSFALNRVVDRHTTIATWDSSPTKLQLRNTFARQAIPMTWDFAEGNPFADSSGTWAPSVEWVARAIEHLPRGPEGTAVQANSASQRLDSPAICSSDPPYFDNVPYADLSDFFYIWLRRSLQQAYPELFVTVLVPKADELVADAFRHGGKEDADAFFLSGMSAALANVAQQQFRQTPAAIYYAFKQTETGEQGTASTGWETFLEAILRSGLAIVGTLPLRTELGNRMRGLGSNALASSVVLVCRDRKPGAESITRGEFRRSLRAELPSALRSLQQGNIAPVDVAQASIGPGMAIFSRHGNVLEPDGTPMSVRSALQLINEALDEYLNQQEGEVDSDTRFAVTWFESNQFNPGAYGDAETLAKARNVSVAGVKDAGILESSAGKVRLKKRDELPAGWHPAKDETHNVWEATQHLIKRLEGNGEQAAADLVNALGPTAEKARDLAYRLYSVCERKKWTDEARAYNGLVIAWPELERLAQANRSANDDPQRQLL